MPDALGTPPPEQTNQQLLRSYVILSKAYESGRSFLSLYRALRKDRKGVTTDQQQDVLRAMLLFSAAGLDAFMKQITRDTLKDVISGSQGAQEQFKVFLRARLQLNQDNLKADKRAMDLWVDALSSVSAQDVLLQEYLNECTGSSLQSKDEIFRLASRFDIPSKDLIDNVEFAVKVFQVRNKIIHEMDVDWGSRNRKRKPRKESDMIAYAKFCLDTGTTFYQLVGRKLGT